MRAGRGMTRIVAFAAGIAAIAAIGSIVFLPMSDGAPLADPECPDDAPIMAFNVRGDLRQDDIAVLRRDGQVRRLTNDHASWDPSFSPDGSQIVFTTGRRGMHLECCGFDQIDIYVMNSDGTNQRPLMEIEPFGSLGATRPSDELPAWSPDGRYIAFVRGGQIMMTTPEGDEPTVLYEAPERGFVGSITWAPDSERLAFSLLTIRPEREDILVVDVASKRVTSFARDVGVEGDIDWSSDGATIAFESYPNIFTVSRLHPQPARVVRDAYAPAWAPEANELAYIAERGDAFDRKIFRRSPTSDREARVDTDGADVNSFEEDLAWLDCPAR